MDTALSHARTRRGFSLIEAAIVLGVFGVVIGGIWVAASAWLKELKKTELQRGMVLLIQNIRAFMPISLWPTHNSAATDITQTLISARVIPTNLLVGAQVINPVSGEAMQITILHPPYYPNRYELRIVSSTTGKREADDTMIAHIQAQKHNISYAYCSNGMVDWVYNPPITTPWPPDCPNGSYQALVYYKMAGDL